MNRLIFSVFLAISLATGALAQSQSASQGGNDNLLGKQVIIPALRPELEPGKSFAGNDEAVKDQLRELMYRPVEETDAILSELEGYGLDKLAPPILFEYSRRLKMAERDDWLYYNELGNLRMMYDARACRDTSAMQFNQIIAMQLSAAMDELGDYGIRGSDPEQRQPERMQVLRRLMDNGAPFDGKASAWWICSHGSSNMIAAMAGRALTLDDWWVGEEALADVRLEAETAIKAILEAEGF